MIKITYYTLGNNKQIYIKTDSTIKDLKEIIRDNENLYLNINIQLINNNNIIDNNEHITESEYYVIYEDLLKEFKEKLKNNEKMNLNVLRNELDKYKLIIDKDLLKILKDYKLIHYSTNQIKYIDFIITEFIVCYHNITMVYTLDLLKYQFPEHICDYATYNNDINIMIYLYNKGKRYKYTHIAYKFAIIHNNIEIIKFLKNTDCKYDISIYFLAVEYNRLHLIKYFDRNGFNKPIWFEDICENTASFPNKFLYIKYYNKNKYNFNKFTYLLLDSYNDRKTLNYLYKNGHKIPETIIKKYKLK